MKPNMRLLKKFTLIKLLYALNVIKFAMLQSEHALEGGGGPLQQDEGEEDRVGV